MPASTEEITAHIASSSRLTPATVAELLGAGWAYTQNHNGPNQWTDDKFTRLDFSSHATGADYAGEPDARAINLSPESDAAPEPRYTMREAGLQIADLLESQGIYSGAGYLRDNLRASE